MKPKIGVIIKEQKWYIWEDVRSALKLKERQPEVSLWPVPNSISLNVEGRRMRLISEELLRKHLRDIEIEDSPDEKIDLNS